MRRHAALFKAVADRTRLRILHLVLTAEEPSVCVCELADALNLPQYVVSKHLAVLRQAGLVDDERVGTWVHYRPASGRTSWERQLCDLVAAIEDGETRRDRQRLHARLTLREGGQCVVGPRDPRVEFVFARAGLSTPEAGGDPGLTGDRAGGAAARQGRTAYSRDPDRNGEGL